MEGLCQHDVLSVGGAAVLANRNNHRPPSEAHVHGYPNRVAYMQLVEPLAQKFVLIGVLPVTNIDQILVLLLGLDYLFRDRGELPVIKTPQEVDNVILNEIGEVQNFNVLVEELLHEVRDLHCQGITNI